MKRQRQDEDDQQNNSESTMGRDNSTVTTNATSTSTATATTANNNTNNDPAYGSKEYWEKRYKRNQEYEEKNTIQNDKQQHTISENSGIGNNGDDISPGHEWYFTYQELKSLILPLILDARGEEFDQWSDTNEDDSDRNGDQNEDEDDDGWDEVVEGEEEDDDDENNDKDDKDGKEDENKDEEEEESQMEQENDESTECDENYSQIYKSKGDSETQFKPKKILEIGCGDVPLGRDICHNLHQFQSMTGVNAKSIVDKIICFDYSATVIDLLLNNEKDKEKDSSSLKDGSGDLKVDYDVFDARKLPFKERQFDLILDKGTLDAMLSDKDEGKKNCVQIVSEASRLLTFEGESEIEVYIKLMCHYVVLIFILKISSALDCTNTIGYLLIVSHLNACNSEGLSWVEEVLVTGLRDGDNFCNWRIEVHSSSDVGEDDVFSDDKESVEDKQKDCGPAVYIIQKQGYSSDMISEKRVSNDKNVSKVDLKFFGY